MKHIQLKLLKKIWNRCRVLSLTVILILSVACCFYISRKTYENRSDDKSEAKVLTQIDMKLAYIIQGAWEDRLYEKYEMNQQRGLRKLRHLFWWEQITSEEDRKEAAQTYGLDIPELDFANHYYIFSFGRKLNGVKYDSGESSKSEGMYTEVEIDFSEDHPDQDMMLENEEGNFISRSNLMARNVYIYAMDKIALMDTSVDYEDLIALNYNYTESNLKEMPLTYMGEVDGEWQEYDGFQTYTYSNVRELRHEGVAWWYQIHGDWEWYQEIFHIEGQDFELEGGKYIISLGRKIDHLWYSPYESDHGYGKEHYAKAAFDMEHYDKDAIYIYKLEEGVNFIDTMLDDWELVQFNFVDVSI